MKSQMFAASNLWKINSCDFTQKKKKTQSCYGVLYAEKVEKTNKAKKAN